MSDMEEYRRLLDEHETHMLAVGMFNRRIPLDAWAERVLAERDALRAAALELREALVTIRDRVPMDTYFLRLSKFAMEQHDEARALAARTPTTEEGA